MTKLKFIDERENTIPTFDDLNIGDSFTSVNEKVPCIKIAVMYDDHKDAYNTMTLDGDFYWFDDDEEIEPIQEIEIIIKK